MTSRIIELNDRAIRVSDESGIILQSPGFALVDDSIVLLGEEAEKQARLKPTSSYNKFWQQLSLDPLKDNSKFRHYGDIAHAHLLHLAEIAGLENEVIFAVPGSFNRQQLSILLGLAQHTPIKPVGVVDTAVAAAVAMAEADTVVYADMHLHQVVLTRLRHREGSYHSDSVIQIPGVGSQNFMDLMMQLATGLFIQQCRFNPQYDAASEQQLYNSLPSWLAQDEKEGNLILELKSGANTHTAKMPRESLINSLSSHYRKISEPVLALAENQPLQLLLSQDLAAMPGLVGALNRLADLQVVAADEPFQAVLRHQALIRSGDDGLHLVTTLPAGRSETQGDQKKTQERPTHALFKHRAYPVKDLEIVNGDAVNGAAVTGLPRPLKLSIEGLPTALGRFDLRRDGLYIESAADFRLNSQECRGSHKLALGDSISFPGSNETISVIRVNHG